MRIVIAALASIVGLFSVHDAQAKPIGGDFTVGNWEGGAYSNDRTGDFSHCAAVASYRHGVSLFFMVTKDFEWAVAFRSDKFSVKPGRTIKVGIALDSRRTAQVEAYAIDSKFLRVSLDPKADLFRRFQQAAVLRLEGSDRTYEFNLTNTRQMLPRLLECASARSKPSPSQDEVNRDIFKEGPISPSSPTPSRKTPTRPDPSPSPVPSRTPSAPDTRA